MKNKMMKMIAGLTPAFASVPLFAEETGGSGSTTSSGASDVLTAVQNGITENLELVWPVLAAIVGAGIAIWVVIKLVRIIKRTVSSAT